MTQNNYGGTNYQIQTGENNTNIFHPSPSPAIEPKRFQIPFLRNPYFTGRSELLTALHETLGQTGAAALNQAKAIYGLGGVGKTQTAIEYAHRYFQDQQFYEWVFWVNASELTLTPDFGAIATKLSLPNHETQILEEKIAAVQRWLETHDRWLLIFDNADRPDLLKPLRPRNPNGRLLLTSRSQEFDSLEIAQPIAVSDMSVTEAREFLLRRTEKSAEDAIEATAVDRLAQELGYLPLALEQAGAYILAKKLSFGKYLSAYRQRRLQLLEQKKPQTGDYPASVATTWALNFEAVQRTTPAAAELLNLSAFLASEQIPFELLERGSAELGEVLAEALALATDDPLVIPELLSALTCYSLVRVETQDCYSIHRMVQEVLRDAMDSPTKQCWIERSIEAVNQVFPSPKFEAWGKCERLVSHVQVLVSQLESYSNPPVSMTFLLHEAGSYLYKQGRYGNAELLLLQSLEISERQLGENDINTAASLSNLGLLYRATGRYKDAEPLYVRSLKISEKCSGKYHPETAASLNNLALLYKVTGRYGDAEQLYKRSLKISERWLGKGHPNTAVSLNNLAKLYELTERYSEAQPLLERSLQINESQLGADHPDTARSLNNLAGLYNVIERYGEAEPLLLRSLEIREKQLGANHPEIAQSLSNLAKLCESTERYSEAESLHVRALEICETQLGADHPETATSLNNLAALYKSIERYDDAEPLLMRSLKISERQLGKDHLSTAISLNNLAGLYKATGRFNEAESMYVQALQIRGRQLGAKHFATLRTLSNLAGLYKTTERYGDDQSCLNQALEVLEKVCGTNPFFPPNTRASFTALRQHRKQSPGKRSPKTEQRPKPKGFKK